jgi:hypothetical protein
LDNTSPKKPIDETPVTAAPRACVETSFLTTFLELRFRGSGIFFWKVSVASLCQCEDWS